jgi:hypothetical protein
MQRETIPVLGLELSGFLVFPDVVVADGQLRPELHFPGIIVHGFVEHPVDQPLLVVGVIDDHPHLLADPGGLVGKLDLDVVAVLVGRHVGS